MASILIKMSHFLSFKLSYIFRTHATLQYKSIYWNFHANNPKKRKKKKKKKIHKYFTRYSVLEYILLHNLCIKLKERERERAFEK